MHACFEEHTQAGLVDPLAGHIQVSFKGILGEKSILTSEGVARLYLNIIKDMDCGPSIRQAIVELSFVSHQNEGDVNQRGYVYCQPLQLQQSPFCSKRRKYIL